MTKPQSGCVCRTRGNYRVCDGGLRRRRLPDPEEAIRADPEGKEDDEEDIEKEEEEVEDKEDNEKEEDGEEEEDENPIAGEFSIRVPGFSGPGERETFDTVLAGRNGF